MADRSFERMAGLSAIVVGVTSLLYGALFLTLFPAAQRSGAPSSLTSFNENPTPLAILSFLLALGGVASTAAVVGVYRRLRDANEGIALWSLGIGLAYGVLTALQAVYQYYLANALSAFYAHPKSDPSFTAEAVRAAAVVLADAPSPVNTYGFSKFFLSGLWLLLVGILMLRNNYFPRALAYVALVASAGVILLFVGQTLNLGPLIFATGVPGSAIVGPLFWLWVGWTLWKKE